MRITRSAFWAIWISLTLSVNSCESVKVEGPTGPDRVSVGSVSVSPASFSLVTGGTQQLTATVRGSNNSTLTDRTVTWTSSATGVATVTGGLVTAVAPGSVTITASAEGVSGSATGEVGNPAPAITTLSPASASYGQAGFQLTVLGSGFVPASVVRLNGGDRATQFVSAGELRASVLAADLKPAGEKAITVFNPAPGGGTSSASNLQVTLCEKGALALGSSGAGTLVAGDCLFDDGTFFHTWTFQGTAGQLYQAALESAAFDAYLVITDPTGTAVGADDSSGAGSDSRLTIKAASGGTYRIFANSFTQGQGGGYTIRFRSLTELPLESPVAGVIPVSSRTGGGQVSPGGPLQVEGVPADRFGFQVAAGQGILVEARPGAGSSLNPALEVFELSGTVAGGNYNSDPVLATGGEIVAGLAEASRWGSLDLYGWTGSTGTYQVSVQECRVFSLTLGGSAAGSTSATTDCALAGAGVPGTGFATVFLVFEGSTGQRVSVSAFSAWDNFLVLLGPNGALLGSDDDSGGGTNARIIATLPGAGRYTALLAPFLSGTGGAFTATLSLAAGAPSQPAPGSGPIPKEGKGRSVLRYLSPSPFPAGTGGQGEAPEDSAAPGKAGGILERLKALGFRLPPGSRGD